MPGSTVSAVSRASDSVNLFAIDKTGNVCHAWWSGARGWECIGNKYEILGTGLTPGAPLAAIARTSNHLDLFTTGKDGRVLTANWGGASHGPALRRTSPGALLAKRLVRIPR